MREAGTRSELSTPAMTTPTLQLAPGTSAKRLVTLAFTALALALALFGCNALTGADQLVVDDEEQPSDDDGDGGDGADSSSGGGPNGGSTGEGAGTPMSPVGDAEGYTVEEVAFYQAVESTVFSNGATHTPTVSLVANRPAVVRVFARTGDTSGAPVTARLTIGANPPLEKVVNDSLTPRDDDYDSTINFDVPASYMTTGATWRVELLEEGTVVGSNPSATTPVADLETELSHGLRVTLVPIRYQADGSGRMPDTSAAQLERYRVYFMTLFPATSVEIGVGPTLDWNQYVDASGDGWDTLLNAVSQERQSANVAFDEYYYGVFEPSGSFNQFCSGGCVAGLGFIGDPGGEYSRAAIGLGYGGDGAAWTAVHEVGHNHGRPHSPCGGVSGADPSYPHSAGAIGVWGMDIFGHQLIPPTFKDFMGYCENTWISDYVYEEVLSFMQDTGGAQSVYVPEPLRDQTWERISIGGSNADAPTWLEPVTLARPPMGPVKNVEITLDDGSTKIVQGSFFAYDHLPGGVLFMKKETGSRVRALDIDLQVRGVTKTLRIAR